MRHFFLLSMLALQCVAALQAKIAPGASGMWSDLQAKREALKSFHQEFAVSQSFKTAQHTQASTSSLVVDCAAGRWRERSISGTGDHVTLFDGQGLLEFEDQGDEYARLKHPSKQAPPRPELYSLENLDLSKAAERERRPCGLTHLDHACVVIDMPLMPSVRNSGNRSLRMVGGFVRMTFDTITGLLISSRTIQNIDDGRGGYQSDTAYILRRMSYNLEADESLFRLPSGVTKEVKELSRWDADKIKKQLAGKRAPDFELTDIHGKTIKVTDLKGKTVLLDFWATWCGPCRADGPSLDKLYRKYGQQSLVIIGVSVSEERATVEKFLSEHPHQYSIALTTENEIPRPYQIGVFPTYVVIDSDGNLASAIEGDKGFSELRRILKKAGLDTD